MPTIELLKPLAGAAPDHPRAIRDRERFDRGERVILVDGERWGRTEVVFRGPHGTQTYFAQEGGERITVRSEHNPKRFNEVAVWSGGRANRRNRFATNSEATRKNVDLVLDKVRELVASGLLRDPKIVRAEVAARSRRLEARHRAAQQDEEERFRSKAIDSLLLPADRLFTDSEEAAIARVVDAMRWAQTQ